MKSVISAVALISFIGSAALSTNAFAREAHHSQTQLVAAKKTHKASKTSHKKAKKKSEGVPS